MIKRIKSNNNFFKRLNYYFDSESKKKENIKHSTILFCPLNGSQINTSREALMAKFCEQEGASATMLFVSKKLDFSVYYKSSLQYFSYLFKVRLNRLWCKKIGLKRYTVSYNGKVDSNSLFDELILNPKDFIDYTYRGVLIGDLVLADTIRYFQCFGPMWEDEKFMKVLRKSFNTAIYLTHSYEKTLKDLNPDKIVMSHGIYVLWGILFRLAKINKVPVDVYGSSYRKNTLRFYHDVPNAPMPMYNWPKFEDVQLSKGEHALINSYIKSRENQSEDNISLFSNEAKESNVELYKFIENAKSKHAKICTLYTNIAWDAYSFSGATIFKDMAEWIIENIKFFKANPTHFLILKAHPAEVYFKVPEEFRIKSIISQFVLPENILFLDESSNVKPFALYPITDVGLVNISTVAIEMAFENKAVLTSGAGGQYAGKGFTIDPTSIQDYFEQLTQLLNNNLNFKPDLEMAKRYLFFRFFREAIPFDIVESIDIYSIAGVKEQSIEQFLDNKNMKIIVNGILNDEPFLINNFEIN